jgi:hypothetical protein
MEIVILYKEIIDSSFTSLLSFLDLRIIKTGNQDSIFESIPKSNFTHKSPDRLCTAVMEKQGKGLFANYSFIRTLLLAPLTTCFASLKLTESEVALASVSLMRPTDCISFANSGEDPLIVSLISDEFSRTLQIKVLIYGNLSRLIFNLDIYS